MSPLLLLLAGCEPPYPEAFHYHIDRTMVIGVQAFQRPDSSWYYDALVVSPHEIESVHAEICGMRTDTRVYVLSTCFGEPALIERVAGGLPGSFSLPPVEFECDPSDFYGTYTTTFGGGSGGSGATYDDYSYNVGGPCDSVVPLRVVARSPQDVGSAFVELYLGENQQRPDLDPRTADPALELQDGEPRAGGEVTLAFSLSQPWFAWEEPTGLSYRWYVDDGELLGTGRTGTTRVTDGRFVGENTLRIPEGYHGPLQVAVVAELYPPVWKTLVLEVP